MMTQLNVVSLFKRCIYYYINLFLSRILWSFEPIKLYPGSLPAGQDKKIRSRSSSWGNDEFGYLGHAVSEILSIAISGEGLFVDPKV
jgi:hypothetical protein